VIVEPVSFGIPQSRNTATSKQNREVRPFPTRNKGRPMLRPGANPLKNVGYCGVVASLGVEHCPLNDRPCVL